MKALIAEFIQETNSFCPFKTSLRGQEYRVVLGSEASNLIINREKEMKGFIDVLNANNADIYISASVFLGSGGEVERQTYETIANSILLDIRKQKPEILLLALHGAMSVEGVADGTGYFLKRCKQEAGENCIIAVTLDMHANVTPLMVEMADFICGYKKYPHTDLYDAVFRQQRMQLGLQKKRSNSIAL